jgi:hypothetical protein
MSDEPREPHERRARVRHLIGERLRSGVLPRFRGQRTYGGRGEGAGCGCCDEPIAPSDVQYDVDQRDAAEGEVPERVRSIPMHLPCYRLWVEESETPSTP